jgi:CBS domain-containing protein
MAWERVRHIPVEDKDHRLVGLVTYRAVLRLLTSGGSLRELTVRDLMKTNVTTVGIETPTIDAIQLMRKLRIGCLPVLHDDRLVGILTEEDFMTVASKLLEEKLK